MSTRAERRRQRRKEGVLVESDGMVVRTEEAARQAGHAGGGVRPHLPCPECGFKIEISLPELLTRSEFVCPGCNLKLTMDRDESKNALEMMQQLHIVKTNMDALKKQSL